MGQPGLWARVTARTGSALRQGLRALGAFPGPDFYPGLEQVLISADVGPALATRLVDEVRRAVPRTAEDARRSLEAAILGVLSPVPRELRLDGHPACVLLYGINGAGKTTSAGKLASRLREMGRRPLLVAADTYRAAAIEQSRLWAHKAGVPCFAGAAGADPGAVVFDALTAARGRGHDVVVVDTAGRLQTRRDLVAELAKVVRVAGKAASGAPHEALLVVDATLGQASLAQARGFQESVTASGIVLAKLDGSARGGAVIGIESELRLPTKLVGSGEEIDDLAAFDPREFVSAILGPATDSGEPGG